MTTTYFENEIKKYQIIFLISWICKIFLGLYLNLFFKLFYCYQYHKMDPPPI